MVLMYGRAGHVAAHFGGFRAEQLRIRRGTPPGLRIGVPDLSFPGHRVRRPSPTLVWLRRHDVRSLSRSPPTPPASQRRPRPRQFGRCGYLCFQVFRMDLDKCRPLDLDWLAMPPLGYHAIRH
jgi:hypothetical protein